MVARPFAIAAAASTVALAGLAGGSGAVPPSATARTNLFTGTWRANDGATYYIRQIGSAVYWTGLSGTPNTPTFGSSFTNVFTGTWYRDGTIRGKWADVPRGQILGSGTLILRVQPSGALTKISETGTGFGASSWRKS
jgi:hypothetical protein